MQGDAINLFSLTHARNLVSLFLPLPLSYLARAYADLRNFDDARHCIAEAMTAVETTKERWFEAEVNRVAGETALLLPEPDRARAQHYFEPSRPPANNKPNPGNSALP